MGETSPNRARVAEHHLKIWDKNLAQNLGHKFGANGRTDRQTDKQTNRQTDRQTDRAVYRVDLQLKRDMYVL